MNIHQTEAHGNFLEAIGWKVEKHKFQGFETYYFLRKIPWLPIYFLKIQRLPLGLIDWNFVNELCRRIRVVETVVEVDKFSKQPIQIKTMVDMGYKPTNDYMLTTKTRIMDLTKPAEQLLKEMKPKTRYNLKKSGTNGLMTRIRSLDEVVKNESLFQNDYQVIRNNAARIKMLLLPKDWIRKQWLAFKDNGFMVEVNDGNKLVAVATFYLSDTTCSYNLNGSTEVGRKKFAPTLAVWTGLVEAKKRKKQIFDFDGVCDERYVKQQRRFAGFGRFKAGFGGMEVYFPPMYRKRNFGITI